MTDDELRPVLSELEMYEGRVPWLYLDNATPANVTVGVGCLMAKLGDACALPFQCDGRPATQNEITQAWLRVRSMPGGLRANAYRSNVQLLDADIDALAFARMRSMLAGLSVLFPDYPGFPLGVRRALLDLAWNCGLGAAPGLRGWTHLLAACNSDPPDWAEAARQCTTSNPNNSASREARNAWRAQQIVDAAKGSTT